jgi:hypothetical protein
VRCGSKRGAVSETAIVISSDRAPDRRAPSEWARAPTAKGANGVVACIHAWWHTDRTPEVDPLAEDQAALETSRQRILATADRVVPGHGEPFEAGRSS